MLLVRCLRAQRSLDVETVIPNPYCDMYGEINHETDDCCAFPPNLRPVYTIAMTKALLTHKLWSVLGPSDRTGEV